MDYVNGRMGEMSGVYLRPLLSDRQMMVQSKVCMIIDKRPWEFLLPCWYKGSSLDVVGPTLALDIWIRYNINVAIIQLFLQHLLKCFEGLVFKFSTFMSFTSFYQISFTKNFIFYHHSNTGKWRMSHLPTLPIFISVTSLYHPGAWNMPHVNTQNCSACVTECLKHSKSPLLVKAVKKV